MHLCSEEERWLSEEAAPGRLSAWSEESAAALDYRAIVPIRDSGEDNVDSRVSRWRG
jgi:hypothetical protein